MIEWLLYILLVILGTLPFVAIMWGREIIEIITRLKRSGR